MVEIKRGEKRLLLEVKILADKKSDYVNFKKFSISEIGNLSAENIKAQILEAGVWPNFVQRPFGTIADPAVTPKAIHISAFDTHPLAPDYSILFKGQDQFFQAGVDILKN